MAHKHQPAAGTRLVVPAAVLEEPVYVVGRLYMFFLPGGFTMAGWYVRPLGLGTHRFARVRHMRHAGNVELAAMCTTGVGPDTVWAVAPWRILDVTPWGVSPWDGPVPAGWAPSGWEAAADDTE